MRESFRMLPLLCILFVILLGKSSVDVKTQNSTAKKMNFTICKNYSSLLSDIHRHDDFWDQSLNHCNPRTHQGNKLSLQDSFQLLPGPVGTIVTSMLIHIYRQTTLPLLRYNLFIHCISGVLYFLWKSLEHHSGLAYEVPMIKPEVSHIVSSVFCCWVINLALDVILLKTFWLF